MTDISDLRLLLSRKFDVEVTIVRHDNTGLTEQSGSWTTEVDIAIEDTDQEDNYATVIFRKRANGAVKFRIITHRYDHELQYHDHETSTETEITEKEDRQILSKFYHEVMFQINEINLQEGDT